MNTVVVNYMFVLGVCVPFLPPSPPLNFRICDSRQVICVEYGLCGGVACYARIRGRMILFRSVRGDGPLFGLV